jgi:hypothetical protein
MRILPVKTEPADVYKFHSINALFKDLVDKAENTVMIFAILNGMERNESLHQRFSHVNFG